jgi:hypothetical protein
LPHEFPEVNITFHQFFNSCLILFAASLPIGKHCSL